MKNKFKKLDDNLPLLSDGKSSECFHFYLEDGAFHRIPGIEIRNKSYEEKKRTGEAISEREAARKLGQ
jgi:hypothetical protein